ncbi:MAG: OmpA family protein [Hyphomonadaceae bacterium]|nr:OmpA family protein [Hyphomonadaceae bacterium]
MSDPATTEQPGWRLFWMGLAGAALIAALALFGWHDASVRGVPRVLEGKVDHALKDAGYGALFAEMDGQSVLLAGAVPDAGAKAEAVRVALTAAGPGGQWAGGVTAVDARDLFVGEPVSPYVWRATKRGKDITLSGYAPTRRVKQQLADSARSAAREGRVTDESRVAAGAANAAWGNVASDAIKQLALLENGEARFVDGQLVIIGEGEESDIEAINARYRSPLAAPYRARLEINVAGEGVQINDLGEIDLSNPGADQCQGAFAGLMERNVINFATGSAAIDAESRRLLDDLARISYRCDRFMIEIAGHTDNVGPREANLSLSRQRAQAVLDYLAGQGVARDRLRAAGYGPDRPRASNASAVGQAANRRIEFKVSG